MHDCLCTQPPTWEKNPKSSDQHRVNRVGQGRGQAVFSPVQIWLKSSQNDVKSSQNPLKSCVFRGTRHIPTTLKGNPVQIPLSLSDPLVSDPISPAPKQACPKISCSHLYIFLNCACCTAAAALASINCNLWGGLSTCSCSSQ